jgi:hypothetical protein
VRVTAAEPFRAGGTQAVKIIEDICVNNTLYDRGPAILRNELPEVRPTEKALRKSQRIVS